MSREPSTLSTGSRKKIEQYSYSLNDKIGKGYSSIVYRGRNDETNETVAVKVIDMKSIRDSIAKEMLQCEIQALKTLNHPNILNCFDVFTTVNNCYIITELCSEGDLASLIKQKKRLPEDEASTFITDIIAGFLEIAEKNYLHRDLKLANIFISKGAAKIADFGFAKKNLNPGEKEKYNVGSPLYMSPEALKRNIYTVKNDIWSIGVIIYQLLHGETPWECRTEKELMEKMVKVPVRFSSSVKISEDLKEFIKKCLEVDETKRIGVEGIKSNSYIKSLLAKKPTSITRRQSDNRDQPKLSLRGFENRVQKAETMKPSTGVTNKQNIPTAMAKPVVDKNNCIVIHHINLFRLLYKILEQLKNNKPQETELIQTLSNEILTRVVEMNDICTGKAPLSALQDITEPDKYFNEATNPGFKKYRTVVAEYHRKYSEELKKDSSIMGNIDRKLKDLLKSLKTFQNRQLLWVHWMVEYLLMPKEIKKNYIESIIEPQSLPTEQQIRNRMKLIV